MRNKFFNENASCVMNKVNQKQISNKFIKFIIQDDNDDDLLQKDDPSTGS